MKTIKQSKSVFTPNTLKAMTTEGKALATDINKMVSGSAGELATRKALRGAVGIEQKIDGKAAADVITICAAVFNRLAAAKMTDSVITEELDSLTLLSKAYREYFKFAIGGKEYTLQSRTKEGKTECFIAEKTGQNGSKKKTAKTPAKTPAAKKGATSGKKNQTAAKVASDALKNSGQIQPAVIETVKGMKTSERTSLILSLLAQCTASEASVILERVSKPEFLADKLAAEKEAAEKALTKKPALKKAANG